MLPINARVRSFAVLPLPHGQRLTNLANRLCPFRQSGPNGGQKQHVARHPPRHKPRRARLAVALMVHLLSQAQERGLANRMKAVSSVTAATSATADNFANKGAIALSGNDRRAQSENLVQSSS